MGYPNLAAGSLALAGLLALAACQQPVTYGTQVGMRGGDRTLEARDPQAIEGTRAEPGADQAEGAQD